MFEKVGLLLSNPIMVFVASTLLIYLTLSSFRRILKKVRNIPEWAVVVVALINGAMSVAAEVLTTSNASPRTIAVYMPIIVFLELLIFGVPGLWGSVVILSIFSFAASTIFSTCVAIVNLFPDNTLDGLRAEKVIPVTLTSLILSFVLLQIKVIDRYERVPWQDIRTITHTKGLSAIVVAYMLTYSMIVAYVATGNAEYLYNERVLGQFRHSIAVNMYIKDVMIFLFGILILVVLAHFVRVNRENSELERDLFLEKGYRKSMQRNAIMRVGYNLMDDTIVEGQEFFSKWVDGDSKDRLRAHYLMSRFCTECVDEAFWELLESFANLDKAYTFLKDESAFDAPIKINPKKFIEFGPVHDDSVKLLAYEDRDWIWINMHGVYVIDESGDVHLYMDMFDVDEKMLNQENIHTMATTDQLTGLLNRSEFISKLNEYTERDGAKGALFMMDLDHFKEVNDNLGHPKGDEVLKETADIMRDFFRQDDIICRLGGDEFCVFAKGFMDETLIRDRARILNERGRRSYTDQNKETIIISFSLGVALYPADADDIRTLYKRADEALYFAKENGRDCAKFYSDTIK